MFGVQTGGVFRWRVRRRRVVSESGVGYRRAYVALPAPNPTAHLEEEKRSDSSPTELSGEGTRNLARRSSRAY